MLPLAVVACLALGGYHAAKSASPKTSQLTVLYEVFLRGYCKAFATFDLKHIESLGCNAIWITPLHPSPSPHGYDVVDYFNVHPDLGTLETFRAWVKRAHACSIKVFMDLVLNHASAKHPWFQRALTEPAEGTFRQRFHFAPLSLGATWHAHEQDVLGFSYRGTFGAHMPDWNLQNPAVQAHHAAVARFWLQEMGVDGFRLDAVAALISSDPEALSWLQSLSRSCRALKPKVELFGEFTAPSAAIAACVATGAFDKGFEFSLAEAIAQSLLQKAAAPLVACLALLQELYGQKQDAWVSFISNHDQDRMASRLKSKRLLRLAALLLCWLPGVPCVYYGDEFGLEGEGVDADRRRPIWSGFPDFSLQAEYRSLISWRRSLSPKAAFSWRELSSERLELRWGDQRRTQRVVANFLTGCLED